jgi:two-component system response regulator AgrA
MLRVFVCEDNAVQLENLTTLINECIKLNKLDMTITMNTQYPQEIIALLPARKTSGLYFLDIDLNCETDAYKLSTIIRKYDPRAFIAIVTADADSPPLIFKHAVEAMDCIIKGTPDFNERVETCIKNAYERYSQNNKIPDIEFKIRLNEDTHTDAGSYWQGSRFSVSNINIFYVESFSSKKHHIYFHTHNYKYLTRMTLAEAEEKFGEYLVRCHSSCLVNKAYVVSVDAKNLKLHLTNGEVLNVGRRHLHKF